MAHEQIGRDNVSSKMPVYPTRFIPTSFIFYSCEAFRNLLLTSAGSTCLEIIFLRRLTTSCIRWTHLQCHLLTGTWSRPLVVPLQNRDLSMLMAVTLADPEEPTVFSNIMTNRCFDLRL